MRSIASILDMLSGKLFMGGLILSKLNMPSIARSLSYIISTISLVCYLIGYLFWLITTQFYPHLPYPTWSIFSSLSEQYQASALIGLIACIICLFFPVYMVPALWMFVVSNALWCLAEYSKLQYKEAAQLDITSQYYYFTYTKLATLVSIITALAASASFCFPVTALPLTIASFMLGNIISILAFYYLYLYVSTNSVTSTTLTNPDSYTIVRQSIGASPALENSVDLLNKHSARLWAPIDDTQPILGFPSSAPSM
jgi:hypothetical protein